jgi:hypothetical protein
MRRRRFGDLFERVASLGNLFAAAKKALRGRGLKMPAVAFAADLETAVVALAHELRSGTTPIGRSEEPPWPTQRSQRRASTKLTRSGSICRRCAASSIASRTRF